MSTHRSHFGSSDSAAMLDPSPSNTAVQPPHLSALQAAATAPQGYEYARLAQANKLILERMEQLEREVEDAQLGRRLSEQEAGNAKKERDESEKKLSGMAGEVKSLRVDKERLERTVQRQNH